MIDLFSLQRLIFSHECNYNLKCGLINYMMGLRIRDNQCYQIAVLFLIKKVLIRGCIMMGCFFFLFVAQPKTCFMEEGIIIRSAGKYAELTCLLVIMNLQFLCVL